MSSLLEDIDARNSYLTEVIKTLNKSLGKAPAGSLRIKRCSNNIQYYIVEKGHVTYIRKADHWLAKAIAQRDYEKKLKRAAEEELRCLKISRTAWPETDMEGVFGTQLQARKDLVTPRVLNAAQYAEQWSKSKYKRKAFSEDFPEFYTKKNERVRSKSEILIANALADSGVPYMYEHPMKLKNGNIIYPDFRVLNVGKRKEYIWEHLGQMDRGIYAENALNRISNY